ncbi:trigger factor [Solemya pervernicosa gill symbiont]|uniref:Trigger factor n=2 Tax=Gammaproteobacteria incertae sedis TaxID=118884 RepID=A0A1T2L6U7_9GAMM|nr:trigger factor [Candidatus Reidiella endopervernicosa]OOZ40835.1 trigger factor [Solemya pervernicosa gill symbiont]QKQ26349.1 trigger factor [Candidatus Reidiella endopervernicosa]
MQVSVETTEGLERRMTIEVPAEEIEQAIESRLESMKGQVKVAGFRPGKVPLKVVKRQYGDQVRAEIVEEAIRNALSNAVNQENLRPAGSPLIEPKPLEAGKALEFSATFEIYPEFELAALEGAKIEKPVVEIRVEDLEQMLNKLRDQKAEWNDVEREAQNGDRVMIDFVGAIDGEEFPGGTGQQVAVVLGANSMIPGFEDGLIGSKAGEEHSLDLTFPEEYGAKELAGKDVNFKVTVTTVAESFLPELDDAFAVDFGVADGGIETLRNEVRANMDRELEQAVKGSVKEQVMELLLSKNEFDVPKALVDQEIGNLMQQSGLQMPPEMQKDPEPVRALFEEQAKKRVKLSLILANVANRNEIKVDPDRVRETVDKVSQTYDNPEEFVKWYYSNREALAHVESLVLEEQIVDWAVEQLEVSEVAKSFEEVMASKTA